MSFNLLSHRLTSAIFQCRGIEGTEPDGIYAEGLEIGHARSDPLEITDPIPVDIGEGARVDLVDARLAPPVWVGWAVLSAHVEVEA